MLMSCLLRVGFADALSKDPHVASEISVDPLAVEGSVKNKTGFEVIKLIAVAKECAPKVRRVSGGLSFFL